MAFQRTTNLDLLLNVAIPISIKGHPTAIDNDYEKYSINTTMTIEKIVEDGNNTYLLIQLGDNRGFYKIMIIGDEHYNYCDLNKSLETTIEFLTTEIQYNYLERKFPQYYQEEGV